MIIPEKIYHSGFPLYLRSLSLDEIHPAYEEWLNDYDTNIYMETRHKKWDLKEIRNFVDIMNKSEEQFLFGIFTSLDQHIGNIKLGPVNEIHKNAMISLFIGEKSFWKKGYASSAISLLAMYAFDVLKLEKLSAGMYRENVGSYKSFIKAGFEHEGTLKDHCMIHGQSRTDLIQVGMSKKNYLMLKCP